MPNTSQFEGILQQIDTLPLAELLVLKAKVNILIESKGSKDNSLERVIELVNEWMTDESSYHEETYPQIEAGLN